MKFSSSYICKIQGLSEYILQHEVLLSSVCVKLLKPDIPHTYGQLSSDCSRVPCSTNMYTKQLKPKAGPLVFKFSLLKLRPNTHSIKKNHGESFYKRINSSQGLHQQPQGVNSSYWFHFIKSICFILH